MESFKLGRQQRGTGTVDIPASGGGDFVNLIAPIAQLIPVGGVVCYGFDDDTLGLTILPIGAWNNVDGQLKFRLLIYAPYAGATVSFHYVIFIHTGPHY